MGYEPLTESALERYREWKGQGVTNMEKNGTDDVPPIIEIWRDGSPMLTIFCPQIDRDMALNAVYFTVPRVNADRVVIVMDAHVTNEMVNPSTGEPWKSGEMQHACDQDDACAIGLLTDCLAVTDYRRDGTHGMSTLPYHVDKDAKEVHWAAESPHLHEFEEGALSGLVPDTIASSFEVDPETVHAPLPEEAPDDPLIVRALKDAYTIIHLTNSGYGVAFMADEENKELFDHIDGILQAFNNMTGSMNMFSSKDVADG